MNKVAVLLTFTTAALAASSIYLAQKLRAERDLTDSLQSRVTQLEQRLTAANARVSELSVASTTPDRPQDSAAPVPQPAVQQPSAANTPTAPAKNRGWDGEAFTRRLANPTYRAAQLAQLRLEMEQRYPDLATALNLQPDEAGRFLDLLAKQALSAREYEMKINDEGRIPDEAVAERRRLEEERRQAIEAERVALLGEAKVQEWNQYQHSLGARAQVRELRTMLAESSFPLREDQAGPLIEALATEQQRHMAERTALQNSRRNPTGSTPQEAIQHYAQRFDLIEQSLERRRQAAALYLSSEQRKSYEELLSRERRRAQIEHDLFITVNKEQLRGR